MYWDSSGTMLVSLSSRRLGFLNQRVGQLVWIVAGPGRADSREEFAALCNRVADGVCGVSDTDSVEDAADEGNDVREGPKPLPDTVCGHYREHKSQPALPAC